MKFMYLSCAAVFATFFAPFAVADDCEDIASLSNEGQTLSLVGYTFNQNGTDNRILQAPPNGQGFCENKIVLTTTDYESRSSVESDYAARDLYPSEERIDWVTGKPARGYASRFQVEPEQLAGDDSAGSLTLRRLQFFIPYSGDPQLIDLDFTLVKPSVTQGWELYASMHAPKHSIDMNLLLGTLREGPDSERRFEVFVEYVSPMNGTSPPKIRLFTHSLDVDVLAWESELPEMMIKRLMVGFLGHQNLARSRSFAAASCTEDRCVKSLTEE